MTTRELSYLVKSSYNDLDYSSNKLKTVTKHANRLGIYAKSKLLNLVISIIDNSQDQINRVV